MPHPDPLQGLDEIPWKSLRHAYGEASDVPGILRNLWSGTDEQKKEAISELHGNVWHQGTIYPATVPTVPFLIRIIQARECRIQWEILYLLQCIYTGGNYLDHHPILVRFGLAEVEDRTEWSDIVQQAQVAVSDGIPVYLACLESSYEMSRQAAVFLMTYIAEMEDENIASRLLEVCRTDESCVVLSCLATRFTEFAIHGRFREEAAQAWEILDERPANSPLLSVCKAALELAVNQQVDIESLSDEMLMQINAAEEEARADPWLMSPPHLSDFSYFVDMAFGDQIAPLVEFHLARFKRGDTYAAYSLRDIGDDRVDGVRPMVEGLSRLLQTRSLGEEQIKELPAILVAAGREGMDLACQLLDAADPMVRGVATDALQKCTAAKEEAEYMWEPKALCDRSLQDCLAILDQNRGSNYSERDMRLQALRTLNETEGAGSAIPLLKEMLANPDEGTRLWACKALWTIEKDMDPILNVMRELLDDESGCRAMAILFAGQIGASALPLLPQLEYIHSNPERNMAFAVRGKLAFADEHLRSLAAEAIRRIRGNE